MRIEIIDGNKRKLFFDSIKVSLDKSWKEIIKEFKISRTSLDRYKSGEHFLPRTLFDSFSNCLDKSAEKELINYIKEHQDNFGRVKGGKKAYKINFQKFEEGRKKGLISLKRLAKSKYNEKRFDFSSVSLSDELCEFAGAFIGDGFFNCYKNKVYNIEFAGDSRYDLPYYQNIIIPTISSVIPVRPKIYKVDSKNSMRVIFYSKELFYFLKDFFNFFPGKKAHSVKIPDKILNSQNNFIRATIRGIFDTDGCIFFDRREKYKKPYPRILLQIVSKNLYEQIKDYLSKEFKLYTRFNEKRKIYVIEIYGINQFKKWMSLIGFSNKRHLDRIASVAQSVRVRAW